MATLYLHGFLSSPDSAKCRMLARAHEKRGIAFIAPDLNCEPLEAAHLIEEIARGIPSESLTVAGSSLGGFYAAWLAARRGCRSLLMNPAVHPWEYVEAHLGEKFVSASGREIEITPRFAEELRSLEVPAPADPERCLLLLSTGDEVLDWREAERKYSACPRILIEGGDHRISNFDQYSEGAADWCCRALRDPGA